MSDEDTLQLAGGIYVTSGDRCKERPFRVCIHDADDSGGQFWTNDVHEALEVFAIKVRRFNRFKRPT